MNLYRMWKLLTETQQQHSQCSKVQNKLKKNLQNAQRQISLMKQMYDSEKSNFEQSKIFFQKRQKQWQGIVTELKKVIQDYESTNNLDVAKASQIFSQTMQMQSRVKGVDRLPAFDKQLSIYSKRNGKHAQDDNEQDRRSANDYDSEIQSKYQRNLYYNSDSHIQTSKIKYRGQQEKGNESMMSNSSKKHRSKIFKSKNFLNKNHGASQSAKKICQRIYSQEMTKLEYFPSNPQNAYQLLSIQDIFQRGLRKTYMKYRNQNMRWNDIMQSQHMQKLKNAKSSTKQRLNKTIRKIFAIDSHQQLEDIIKYIQDRIYKKYHILKGQLAWKFLQQKFRQCEQIFESSNSALSRFDQEPTNFINGININSKFKQFEQKKKQIRSNDSKSLRFNNESIRSIDNVSQSSRTSSQLGGLSINSNIKEKTILTHFNNHMRMQIQNSKVLKKQDRDKSIKNIYTQKRITRRNFVEQLSRSNNSIQIQNKSQSQKNLSSLIGASQEYELTNINTSNRYINDSLKGMNVRTTDQSRM